MNWRYHYLRIQGIGIVMNVRHKKVILIEIWVIQTIMVVMWLALYNASLRTEEMFEDIIYYIILIITGIIFGSLSMIIYITLLKNIIFEPDMIRDDYRLEMSSASLWELAPAVIETDVGEVRHGISETKIKAIDNNECEYCNLARSDPRCECSLVMLQYVYASRMALTARIKYDISTSMGNVNWEIKKRLSHIQNVTDRYYKLRTKDENDNYPIQRFFLTASEIIAIINSRYKDTDIYALDRHDGVRTL